MTTKVQQEPPTHLIQALQVANRLTLKALKAKNKESLIFSILNDTVQIIRYDRALLWNLEQKKPKLLGISGESKVNKNSPVVQRWSQSVQTIEDPSKPQIMELAANEDDFVDKKLKGTGAKLLWLPITCHGKLTLGLWLELWNVKKDAAPPTEIMTMLMNYLMPGYGLAWEKHDPKYSVRKLSKKRWQYYFYALGILFLLFFVQVPLRIVAPCEIVPKDPILMTAPLEGIIHDILVEPGDHVRKGKILFEYDKRVPLQELEVAQKEVEILQSEVKRASILGLSEEKARTELAILTLKLKKQNADLDLAKYHASQLSVKAPQSGIVMLDNPDEWRGKPVKIGEKILALSNPKETEIRIWLPESDNITLNKKDPIKIVLNVEPEKSWQAKLAYIANEAIISEKNVPSFLAEATWVTPPEEVKLGLKGTAILYGKDVTVFYFLFRKPWGFFRNLIGF